jgi:hypothetical protein
VSEAGRTQIVLCMPLERLSPIAGRSIVAESDYDRKANHLLHDASIGKDEK